MKLSLKWVVSLAIVSTLGSFVPSDAQAQVPCATIAPNRAHICWAPATTYVDGTQISAGTVVTYTVQRQTGASWITDGSVTVNDWASAVLAPGSYTYRVIASVNGASSVPSNAASSTVTQPAPNPVTITIAATDDPGANRTPVVRILDPKGTPHHGQVFGLVPLGRKCEGNVVFRYRSQSYRRVAVTKEETWGTKDTSNLAAPCA